jgi:NADH-quinone oxidoreductase subunit L
MLAAILLFPLIGFLVNSVAIAATKTKVSAAVSGSIATIAIFLSFVFSVSAFFGLTELSPESRVIEQVLFSWIHIGRFDLPFVLRLDPLSSLMTLVITGVGSLIHLYSIGYMGHDATPGKFFAYLNLFCFAMLALVLGGNLPILFLGWEGVGLCSYLLIGYWYEDSAKAAAGMKAFVVNRIGDLGFLAGIFFIYVMFNTLDFATLKQTITSGGAAIDVGLVTAATLCLFVGAMGKSAQIPLYVWLPDAMAGPTPVSALIHAATMVTAGIYMICRLNFMFSLAPITLSVISGVGAATALFAATIAIVQKDIKKVLAYSTVSQLGYMFMAAGVGGYVAAVFHLMTHAFFKALLFLGSGSVIHGMHEEQDIMKMGGLQKHMPKTFATFVVGTIAIAGIPPLAGFWSKDEILWNAFASHSGLAGGFLWFVGALTALLTAFYMTRLTCLTFFGKERFDAHKVHPHESPALMTIPLIVLAGLSIFGGFLGIPHNSVLEHWLEPVFGAHHIDTATPAMEWVLMGVSTVIALISVSAGYYAYVVKPEIPQRLYASMAGAHKVLFNKYYVDEFYDLILVRPLKSLSMFFWKIIDMIFVDGFVMGMARASRLSGEVARLFQTGSVQVYAAFMVVGMVLILGYFIYGLY